jgi:hypothetical protein
MYSAYPLKKKKELVFIHTPKCAGSYVNSILSYLKIRSKGHNQVLGKEGITFTVIRDPVSRFESLLNYRLGEETYRSDFPEHLRYVYNDKSITLNEIVSTMTDAEILGFSPFKTLCYWTKNVDIIITVDNLSTLLEYFGYTYDKNNFNPTNVSKKVRGTFDQKTKDRIAQLFKDDVILYNMVMNSSLSSAPHFNNW